MQIILGIIFHFIGGFASGSFYMPYKKVKGWHWENYWIDRRLIFLAYCSANCCMAYCSDFAEIIAQYICCNAWLDLLLGRALGYWRTDLWPGYALSWHVVSAILYCLVFVLHLVHWFHLSIIIFIRQKAKQRLLIYSPHHGEELF